MMTRATVGETRVTIESYAHTCGIRWQWSTEDGRLVNGFLSSADAYEDAQAAHGSDVRIVQHAEPEPPA